MNHVSLLQACKQNGNKLREITNFIHIAVNKLTFNGEILRQLVNIYYKTLEKIIYVITKHLL